MFADYAATAPETVSMIYGISPEGEHLGTIRVPENTGNLTWGGEDWHTVFIPSTTSLYGIKTLVGPRREPYMR